MSALSLTLVRRQLSGKKRARHSSVIWKEGVPHQHVVRFVAWCRQEQASIQQQLELMQSGKVLTGENRGSGWVDTTGDSVKRAKARLAELESLLTEKGSATISKP